MKTIEQNDATGSLSEYSSGVAREPLVVTNHGKPIAALISLHNADVETISLSTNEEFLKLIERSRARGNREGGISATEMRRRLRARKPKASRES